MTIQNKICNFFSDVGKIGLLIFFISISLLLPYSNTIVIISALFLAISCKDNFWDIIFIAFISSAIVFLFKIFVLQ